MIPRIDLYSTHLPLLCAAVAQTTGAVIELGSGLYSTPILQALCIPSGRRLLTIDNNHEWLHAVWRPCHDLHTAQVIANWDELPQYGERLRCDVVFVDAAPGRARGPLIQLMKQWAKIIVVHDTEAKQRYTYPGVEEALASFGHRVEDSRRGPWTTAVSDDPIVLTLAPGVA